MRNSKSGRYNRSVLKGAALGVGILAAGLVSTTSANAQCTGTFTVNFPGFGPVDLAPVVAPAAASVNALVSVFNTTNTAFLTQSTAFIGSPPNPRAGEMGGGIWARGIGGRIDTDSTGVVTSPVDFPGQQLNCNSTARVEFVGYQVGRDIAKLNIDGWNLHAGATVGYMESRAKDVSPGGTGTANSQVPFFGWYGAATKGGFYVDGQIRWDYYNTQLNDPANLVFNQNFNAKGMAVTVGTGYYIPLPNNWFVEPSAGFIWSRTELDAINIPVLPTTIQIDDVESRLGRASLRVGTNFTTGNLALQPFATVSVLHEFADDVTTRFTTCLGAVIGTGPCGSAGPELTAQMSTSRVGTYGQYALGVAGQVINTGWLGYLRGDYRNGDNIDGWSVNGGLRYQFMPEAVAAAPVGKGPVYKAPPPVVAVAPNWTGFYLGGFVGTAYGKKDINNMTGDQAADATADVSGFLGGGQIGYNYQFGKWVLGVEADAGVSNAKGSIGCPGNAFGVNFSFFFNCVNETDWIVTAAGRLGYAYERLLIYGKLGGAWAKDQYTIVSNLTGGDFETASETRSGWMVGTGAEFALNGNWSAKGEWNYMDFGTRSITYSGGDFADIRQRMFTAKIGLNYRFGPTAVTAKY